MHAAPPVDPDNREQLRADAARMRANPTGVERPIVILSGWHSPGIDLTLGRSLRRLTGARPEQTLAIAYPFATSVHGPAKLALRRVVEKFGVEGEWTREVDVVGVSMGGLVARLAASDLLGLPHRLRIARLFTLASPHRGSKLASLVRIDRASRDMRPGSTFLSQLDEAWRRGPYPIIPYAVLGDWMVGASNTAPPGQEPTWFRGPPLVGHHFISSNRAIVIDLARRLRDEEPIKSPSTPPRD